jgi:hypothetical protein
LKEGEGKYIYRNGSYYQGTFKNDLREGFGSLFYHGDNKESKIMRGYWKQGNIIPGENT